MPPPDAILREARRWATIRNREPRDISQRLIKSSRSTLAEQVAWWPLENVGLVRSNLFRKRSSYLTLTFRLRSIAFLRRRDAEEGVSVRRSIGNSEREADYYDQDPTFAGKEAPSPSLLTFTGRT